MSTTQITNSTTTHPAAAAMPAKLEDVVTFINDTSATTPATTSSSQQQQSNSCQNCSWFSPKPQKCGSHSSSSKCGSNTPSSTASPETEPLAPTTTISAELHKAHASRTHFTCDVLNNHRCKMAITELLSPYNQAMFRCTCTTVGHVIQSVASLEKMSTYCTGAVTHDQLSASLHSSEVNAAPLSDGDFDDRVGVHSHQDGEMNNPLSDNNTATSEQSSVLIYPSDGANSLDGDLFRFTPVSLTSPFTSNLSITINIALLAARGSKYCQLSETGGVVIGDGFCSGLRCKSVSFEGTHTVVAIGNAMLRGCCAERISFSPMPRLQIVGNDWMNGCTELRKLEFACDFIALKNVGDNWLRCCRKVKTVDLECFPALEVVGGGWMERCHAITTMTVNKLSKLKTIGDRWLSRCKLLSTISVSNLVTLFTVGDGCLSMCPRLHTVVFEQLPCLKSVGECWLYDCQGLSSLSLIGTDNLRKVGPKWLAGTPNPLISCSNRLQGKMFQASFEDAALRHQVEQQQMNKPPSPTNQHISINPSATTIQGGGSDITGLPTTSTTKRIVGAVGAAIVPQTQLPSISTSPADASH